MKPDLQIDCLSIINDQMIVKIVPFVNTAKEKAKEIGGGSEKGEKGLVIRTTPPILP